MQPESIWDHDLWEDIYNTRDIHLQLLLVRMYRLILDMHNKDILSEQIAHALKGERKLYFSTGQKLGGLVMGILLSVDTVAHIFHL